ncbi:hypothetical protein FJT64_012871 [Amphibalanus amphitrite]|uniref:Uncharacterized protein n=1 Tax=Amphibalanus amphitrite TaxID=1232801 RepID=A0A6A4VB60_AMPAM|nr:hypothetical protein FJT64_012871 [Amphibalanus amphitrite]
MVHLNHRPAMFTARKHMAVIDYDANMDRQILKGDDGNDRVVVFLLAARRTGPALRYQQLLAARPRRTCAAPGTPTAA